MGRKLSWLRAATALAALGYLAWVFVSAHWRTSDGALVPAVVFPIACAAAACVLAITTGTAWQSAGRWLTVAIIGQAATLLMIDAGPRLHYQHFPPVKTIAATHPWLLAIVALQAGAVVVAIARNLAAAPRLPALRAAVAVVLATGTAATVSPSVSGYVAELAWAASLQVVAIVTLVLMALAVPAHALEGSKRFFDRLFGDSAASGAAPRLDRFVLTAAAAAAGVAALLNVLSYQRHPHVPDEVVYLYAARYFAAGMVTLPLPPVPAAFDIDLMMYEPAIWYSPLQPGWSAVLAVGALVGATWLVNPILTGINIVLAYLLFGHLYPPRVARTATALLAASPWFLFLGMSYMTHQVTLTATLVAAVGVVYARRKDSFTRGAIAGAGVGAVSLVRPLDGVIIGTLIALWAVGLGGRRLGWRALTGLLVGTVVIGGLVLPYNRMLTGDPLKFPINVYFDRYYAPNANAYGFGPDRGMGWAIDPNPGHTPVDGLINANLNLFGINTDLFGWSTGSFVFIAWLVAAWAWTRADRLMAAAFVLFFVAYFFYYFSGGPDFAARYWFPVIVPLAALCARGIAELDRVSGGRATLAAAAMTVTALILFLPWRATDKYYQFRGMRPDIPKLAATYGFAGDLVLVRGPREPDYVSAAVYNPLDLRARETIYAWDRNAEVRNETLRAYADRRVWVVDGPTITGAGYRLVQGPLPAAALLAAGGAR
jgi:4-amino-4-deoxy-L-arabinose transferase-like glycosyltransferase